jgi:DNA-binding LytR/AlgR family response regulator
MEGYELDVVDYLLKPIPFDRFMKAATKALSIYGDRQAPENPSTQSQFLFVKADYQVVKITIADILYIEGLKDYIQIFLKDQRKPILTLESLKGMAEKLPKDDFIRVHRSFIIHFSKVDALRKNSLKIGDKDIPVGESYKEEFEKRFGY